MALSDVLLALLAQGEAHGYLLKQRFDQAFDSDLGYGQVYASLTRLEREGMIERDQEQPSLGPAKVIYRLLGPGLIRVSQWLQEPPPPPPSSRADELARRCLVVLHTAGRQAAGEQATQLLNEIMAMNISEEYDRIPVEESLQRVLAAREGYHRQAQARWLHDFIDHCAGGLDP